MTTIAGTGVSGFSGDGGLATLAKLKEPYGVAVNPTTGDVYITDSHRLRLLTKSTGKNEIIKLSLYLMNIYYKYIKFI